MRNGILAITVTGALIVGANHACNYLRQFPAVAAAYNNQATQISRLHRFAQEELQGLLPPTKIRLEPWLEADFYFSGDGKLLEAGYHFNHSEHRLEERVSAYRTKDPGVFVQTKWTPGIYDPRLGTIFLNSRDGLSVRKAGHELIHAALNPAIANTELSPQKRELVEAFAETLGTISLTNAFYGVPALDHTHMTAYQQAISCSAKSVELMGERLPLQVNDQQIFSIAARIALEPENLATRVRDARKALTW